MKNVIHNVNDTKLLDNLNTSLVFTVFITVTYLVATDEIRIDRSSKQIMPALYKKKNTPPGKLVIEELSPNTVEK